MAWLRVGPKRSSCLSCLGSIFYATVKLDLSGKAIVVSPASQLSLQAQAHQDDKKEGTKHICVPFGWTGKHVLSTPPQ